MNTWLVVGWFLTLSFYPQNNEMIYLDASYNMLNNRNSFSQDIELYVEIIDKIRLYTSVKTYNISFVFPPHFYRTDYTLGIECFSKNFIFGILYKRDQVVLPYTEGFAAEKIEIYTTVKGGAR